MHKQTRFGASGVPLYKGPLLGRKPSISLSPLPRASSLPVRSTYLPNRPLLQSHPMAPKPASTAGKAPASTASKAPAKSTEGTKAAKKTSKTAASTGEPGEKKKRRKARKETYSSYIYKGAYHFVSISQALRFQAYQTYAFVFPLNF